MRFVCCPHRPSVQRKFRPAENTVHNTRNTQPCTYPSQESLRSVCCPHRPSVQRPSHDRSAPRPRHSPNNLPIVVVSWCDFSITDMHDCTRNCQRIEARAMTSAQRWPSPMGPCITINPNQILLQQKQASFSCITQRATLKTEREKKRRVI